MKPKLRMSRTSGCFRRNKHDLPNARNDTEPLPLSGWTKSTDRLVTLATSFACEYSTWFIRRHALRRSDLSWSPPLYENRTFYHTVTDSCVNHRASRLCQFILHDTLCDLKQSDSMWFSYRTRMHADLEILIDKKLISKNRKFNLYLHFRCTLKHSCILKKEKERDSDLS